MNNENADYLEILILFPLDRNPEAGLLDYMVVLLFNLLRNLHIIFHSECNHLFTFPPTSAQGFCSHILTNTCYLVFLIIAIQMGIFNLFSFIPN